MEYNNCLAIDLGKTFGWCFKDRESEESGEGKYDTLLDWSRQFLELLNIWKPNVVVFSKTNNFGYWNSARVMLCQAAVGFYLCQKKRINYVELNDSSARKSVFGKAIKKLEAQETIKGYLPNELDAIILARGWLIQQK